MAKNQLENDRYAGIKSYTAERNRTAVEKIAIVLDEMEAKGEYITFNAVAKQAKVARSTLYYNAEVAERIKNIRINNEVNRSNKPQNCPQENRIEPFEDNSDNDKLKLQLSKLQSDKRQLLDEKKQLLAQKDKLIAQLVQMEELKEENCRLKRRLEKI